MEKDIEFILKEMHKLFPNAHCELNHTNPFQLLVSVILSAQTTDKQVNKVTQKLFLNIKHPLDILSIWEDVFSFKIKSIGLYKSKAKNIFKLSTRLVEEYSDINYKKFPYSSKCLQYTQKYKYCIPDKLKDLVSYPGVGEKTAKVFLHVIYWQKLIAVDTHVHRIANRIWIVKTKEPIQTSKKLEKLVPDSLKWIAHHSMIFWWRYQCMARNPKCKECPLNKICDFKNKGN